MSSFDFEKELSGVFGDVKEEKTVDVSKEVRRSLADFRVGQLNRAYELTVDSTKPSMELSSLLSLFLSNPMGRAAAFLNGIMKGGDEQNRSRFLYTGFLALERDGDERIAQGLEKYVNRYNIKDPREISENPKAMARAVVEAYENLDAYGLKIIENLRKYHELVSKLRRFDDKSPVKVDVNQLLGSFNLSDEARIRTGDLLGKFGSLASECKDLRDRVETVARGFLMSYGNVRKEELDGYYAVGV